MQNIYSIYTIIHSPYTTVQYRSDSIYVILCLESIYIYMVSAYTYMYIHTDSSIYTCMCMI